MVPAVTLAQIFLAILLYMVVDIQPIMGLDLLYILGCGLNHLFCQGSQRVASCGEHHGGHEVPGPLLVSGRHPPELLDPTEETLNKVAPSIGDCERTRL